MAGPGICSQRRLDHVGLGGIDLDGGRLAQRDPLDHLAHLVGLVLALGQRHADVEHVGAAGDLVLGDDQQAVVVVGEQQLLGLARALGVDPLADQRRARRLDQRCGRDHRADVGRAPGGPLAGDSVLDAFGDRLRCARAWSRSSRRRSTPRSARRTRPARRPAARAARGRSVSPLGPCRGSPAFGMQWTGTELNSPRKRIASRMSSGPVEQFRPMASTLSASSVASTALMSVPSSILPPWGSRDTLHWIGTVRPSSAARLARAEHRRLELQDVLGGLDDDQVGAALDQAGGLLGEHRRQLGEGDLAERRVIAGRQKAGGADRAGDKPPLAGRLAGDLGRLDVDLVRVSLEAPLDSFSREAWNVSVSSTSAPASSIEHVHTLDHVRAVEHERFVAAARQPVVALQAEVELLQRRAHAAVVHERALACRRNEIPHAGEC